MLKSFSLAIAFSAVCAAQSFSVRTAGVSGEVQVRYFLTGSFGGYGSFVRDADSDGVYRIPLRPETRSLNMALAAAMVLGEALRQTGQFPKERG